MASALNIPSVSISFENFAHFANAGDEHDAARNAVYRVNGDPAFQLVIDGAVTGTAALDGYDAVYAASYVLEDAITLSFAGGQVFTPGAITLSNYATSLANQTLVIKGYDAGNQQVGATVTRTLQNNYYGDLPSDSIALPGMTAITRLVITATTLGNKIEYLMIDGISMTNIEPPPPSVALVSSAASNGAYKAGDLVALTVAFDAAVDVATAGGVPTLQLETGSTDRKAVYASGSGTSTLTFHYTVQAGDSSADLDYLGTAALALNGGSIKAAGSAADARLTLPAPGGPGSLGANKAVAIDGIAPTLAISSDRSTLKAGESATITFSFSENPGASFTSADIAVSGGTLGALGGSGSIRTASFTPAPDTNSGSAAISVVAGGYTDSAGNPGGAAAGPAISFDTLGALLSISSDRPMLRAGESAAITFTFSEDPGASFTLDDISVSGGSLGPLGGSGLTRIASFTPAPAINNGVASITVAAGAYRDAAGNAGGAGVSPALSFDTLAPPVPAIPDLAAASDSGGSSTDDITNAAALSFQGAPGSTEGGATIRLHDSSTLIGTTTAAADGSWELGGIVLGAGTHFIIATAVDAAGNALAPYDGLYLTIDRSAPSAPGVPDLASGSDSGSSASDNVTAVHTPTFSGAAGSVAAGAMVKLYDTDGITVIGSTTAAVDGSWSLTTAPLSEGVHTISARAVDAAGNASAASGALAVRIDRSAPSTAVTGAGFSNDTGISPGDLITASAAQTISGTLDANLAAGERVEVSLDGGGSWLTASAAAGTSSWSLPATLSAGTHALQVRVANAVDNTGPVFARDYTLDSAAPAVTITSSAAQLKLGETATITFSFSEDPGSSFAWDGSAGDLSVTGGQLGALAGSGLVRTAIFTPNAATNGGSAAITIAAGAFADLAGNPGGAGAAPALAFDTLAPAAPSAPALTAASDSGQSASDGITSDATPTFSGSAEDGATVTLYGSDGAVAGSALATGGAWSINTEALPAGAHTFTAVARDAAGNTGAASSAQTITIDRTAPLLAIGSDTAFLKTGQTATVTFSFSEDPGASFGADDILVSGGVLGALTGSGLTRSAVFTPAAGVDGGMAGISVAAGSYSDLAGNDGAAATAPVLAFDTLAPAAPSAPALAAASDSGTAGDGVTESTSPLIEGSAAAHALVTLYDGAAVAGSATADALGKWSIATSLSHGSHSLTAVQRDAAGNLSAPSAAFALRIDAPPPAPPLVDGVPVASQPVLLPGGVLGTAVQVPLIGLGREETSGQAGVADIPLATDGGANLLLAQMAPGFGLAAGGANVSGASALALLIASIRAATPAQTHTVFDQEHLAGNGEAFLAGLRADTSLLVQTISPVSVAAPGGVLTLSGPASAPGQQVALVIDATGLAGGGTIALQDVDFAAVVGSAEVVVRSGSPVVAGDAADQRFTVHAGGAGAVFAGAGHDLITYGLPAAAGNAAAGGITLLHGGLGSDIAFVAGDRDDYEVELHNGYVVVREKANPASKALLVNVDHLAFGDGGVDIGGSTDLSTLAGLYHNVLGRQADLFGFEHWGDARDAGMSWGAIALFMIESRERNGSIGQDGEAFSGNPAADLALLYELLFARTVDEAGLAYWTDAMADGVTLEQVATSMIESIEMVGNRLDEQGWNFSL